MLRLAVFLVGVRALPYGYVQKAEVTDEFGVATADCSGTALVKRMEVAIPSDDLVNGGGCICLKGYEDGWPVDDYPVQEVSECYYYQSNKVQRKGWNNLTCSGNVAAKPKDSALNNLDCDMVDGMQALRITAYDVANAYTLQNLEEVTDNTGFVVWNLFKDAYGNDPYAPYQNDFGVVHARPYCVQTSDVTYDAVVTASSRILRCAANGTLLELVEYYGVADCSNTPTVYTIGQKKSHLVGTAKKYAVYDKVSMDAAGLSWPCPLVGDCSVFSATDKATCEAVHGGKCYYNADTDCVPRSMCHQKNTAVTCGAASECVWDSAYARCYGGSRWTQIFISTGCLSSELRATDLLQSRQLRISNSDNSETCVTEASSADCGGKGWCHQYADLECIEAPIFKIEVFCPRFPDSNGSWQVCVEQILHETDSKFDLQRRPIYHCNCGAQKQTNSSVLRFLHTSQTPILDTETVKGGLDMEWSTSPDYVTVKQRKGDFITQSRGYCVENMVLYIVDSGSKTWTSTAVQSAGCAVDDQSCGPYLTG